MDRLDNLRCQVAAKCSSSAYDQHTSRVFNQHQLRASKMKYEVWYPQIQAHEAKVLNKAYVLSANWSLRNLNSDPTIFSKFRCFFLGS